MDTKMKFGERLLDILRGADRIVALTGAGVSAESGVPTFRDAQQGLWADEDPLQLATPEGFEANPARVWEWYAWRRTLINGVQPNPAHHALAAWEHRVGSFTVVTQNVDGLHQKAGSRRVLELHGNIHRTICSRDWELLAIKHDGSQPRCPRCGALGRPDVVWFGEMLPVQALNDASAAIAQADVVMSLGTSSLVQPAASLPVKALELGIPVLEVNPQQTPLSAHALVSLRGKAGDVLPELLMQL